jgi:acyl carrier protein
MPMTITADDVRRHVAELLHMPEERVGADVELTDLVSDSFVLVEMAVCLQEDYDVFFRQSDLEAVRTVADVVNLVLSRRT